VSYVELSSEEDFRAGQAMLAEALKALGVFEGDDMPQSVVAQRVLATAIAVRRFLVKEQDRLSQAKGGATAITTEVAEVVATAFFLWQSDSAPGPNTPGDSAAVFVGFARGICAADALSKVHDMIETDDDCPVTCYGLESALFLPFLHKA
jgi:hypothetical protein